MTKVFSYSMRIHRSDEFERILKSKAITNKWIALHSSKNELGLDRLGIIVSKRVEAKAVGRNRIKRVVRDVFRVSPVKSINFVDIIVRIKRPIISNETPEFRQALSRLLMNVRMTAQ